MLDLLITQMLDVLTFFHTPRGTKKNCKNVLLDRRVRSWIMRKKRLKSDSDTLPNYQFPFGVSIAFKIIYGFLKRHLIDIGQNRFECPDALNKVIGQDGMSNRTELKVRKSHWFFHRCLCPVFSSFMRSGELY